ncbi:MAG: NAD(P)(+) transhydrogenase (Re/Si-specific) subunit beta, partial [Sphingomicrobium sp.]
MHEAAATPAWVLLAYLISGVCFIVALRGLSSPESSRRGNRAGMIGMAIAVVTTLITHVPAERVRKIGDVDVSNIGFLILRVDRLTLTEIAAAILIGGAIGLITARKIQMTAMPQLVAAFHSLVGMAAVLVGAAAYLNPEAFGIATRITPIAAPSIISILPVSRLEMGLGVAIGAITFSGSVIAFLKLNGNM